MFSTLKKILEKFHVFSIQLLLLACHISVLHFLWLVNQYWYVTRCPYFMRVCFDCHFLSQDFIQDTALPLTQSITLDCAVSPNLMFLMTLAVLRCTGQLSSQSVPLIRIHLIRIYGFLGKDQKCKVLFSPYPQGYLLSILKTVACVCLAKWIQSCLTLCGPMDCSPPGSSLQGILQVGILE